MSNDGRCSIYIGNLDEKVTDRVLYDILIQAGRVLDLHIPRDRDTDEPKGFAFAEYESEEVADYAIRLFSGLVTLYNRTLKFAISGQDKPLQNGVPNGLSSASNLLNKPRSHSGPNNHFEITHHTGFSSPRHSFSGSLDPPGVVHHHNGYSGTNYDSGRRLFGSAVEAISRPRSHHHDSGTVGNATGYYSAYCLASCNNDVRVEQSRYIDKTPVSNTKAFWLRRNQHTGIRQFQHKGL